MGMKFRLGVFLVSMLALLLPHAALAKTVHTFDGGTETYTIEGTVKIKQSFKFKYVIIPRGKLCEVEFVNLKSEFEFIPRAPTRAEKKDKSEKFLYDSVIGYSKNRVLPTMKDRDKRAAVVMRKAYRVSANGRPYSLPCDVMKNDTIRMLKAYRGIVVREIRYFLDQDQRRIDRRAKELMRTGKY